MALDVAQNGGASSSFQGRDDQAPSLEIVARATL
jgi:hypothetical protein